MKKVTTLVLMLCFILSGALCYANGEARTEPKEDGTPSIVPGVYIYTVCCGKLSHTGKLVIVK